MPANPRPIFPKRLVCLKLSFEPLTIFAYVVVRLHEGDTSFYHISYLVHLVKYTTDPLKSTLKITKLGNRHSLVGPLG